MERAFPTPAEAAHAAAVARRRLMITRTDVADTGSVR
jgi:hypothetical protein